jgi:hypothetical protein
LLVEPIEKIKSMASANRKFSFVTQSYSSGSYGKSISSEKQHLRVRTNHLHGRSRTEPSAADNDASGGARGHACRSSEQSERRNRRKRRGRPKRGGAPVNLGAATPGPVLSVQSGVCGSDNSETVSFANHFRDANAPSVAPASPLRRRC